MSFWPSIPCGAALEHNDIKKRISHGCFQAIGSHSGYKLEEVNEQNDSGTDFRLIRQISRPKGKKKRICDAGSILEFQLKSSASWKLRAGRISYSLENKAYNDIVTRNKEGGIPLVLILMCVHKQLNDCISYSTKALKIQHSLYWYYTDATEYKTEDSKILINFPLNQLLRKKSFDEIVSTIAVHPRIHS